MRFLVLHGPNLNLLGRREPDVYGRTTLEEIDRTIERWASDRGVTVRIVQSNHEGLLIDAIHESLDECDGMVINAGGLGHTSVALRDALSAAPPAVAVHLSNIHAREPFRHTDLVAGACVGGVYGFGADVYRLGLEALLAYLARSRSGGPT